MLGFRDGHLNKDVYSLILDLLPIKDRLKIAQLSKTSEQEINSPVYWSKLYKQNDLPETDQAITRPFFAKAYRDKGLSLLKEVEFYQQHKKLILEKFPEQLRQWSLHFQKLNALPKSIKSYKANLAQVDNYLDFINKSLLTLQTAQSPQGHLIWRFLSRFKSEWIDEFLQENPESHIQHLELCYGGFQKLPDNMTQFKHLEILNLYDTTLSSLPDTLANLPHLRMLLCSGGNFSQIPSVIWQCQNLKDLCLVNMNIEQIPQEIQHLSKLEKLYLCDNHIQHLPKELSELQNLRYFPIDRNPLSSNQPQVIFDLFKRLNMDPQRLLKPEAANSSENQTGLNDINYRMSRLYLPSASLSHQASSLEYTQESDDKNEDQPKKPKNNKSNLKGT